MAPHHTKVALFSWLDEQIVDQTTYINILEANNCDGQDDDEIEYSKELLKRLERFSTWVKGAN